MPRGGPFITIVPLMFPVQPDSVTGVLHGYNPWWSTGRVPPVDAPPARREEFETLVACVGDEARPARVLLTGPRRVGKTTLLHQLVDHLLARGVDPSAILYVDLGHPVIQLTDSTEIVRQYLKNVLEKLRRCWLLFDDAHASKDWLRGVDLVQRRGNLDAHVVATATHPDGVKPRGRSRVNIGDWTSLSLPTLQFREFVSIVRPGLDLDVPQFLGSESPRIEADDLLENHHTNRTLTPLFNDYLLRGGFPEVAQMRTTPELIQRHLREDVVERILLRDVAHLHGAHNLPELERLFIHIALQTGNRFNLSDLAISLGISRSTVSKYIRHMESTLLIYLVRNFRGRGAKGLRSRPRIYVVDGSLRNAVLMRGAEFLQRSSELDTVVRTVLMTHLGILARERGWRLHHYRDRLGTRSVEVDAVIETEEDVIPVALRYRADVGPEEIQDIYSFMGKHKCRQGYLLTRGTTKKRIRETFFEDIYEVPLWTFLYGLPSLRGGRHVAV